MNLLDTLLGRVNERRSGSHLSELLFGNQGYL